MAIFPSLRRMNARVLFAPRNALSVSIAAPFQPSDDGETVSQESPLTGGKYRACASTRPIPMHHAQQTRVSKAPRESPGQIFMEGFNNVIPLSGVSSSKGEGEATCKVGRSNCLFQEYLS